MYSLEEIYNILKNEKIDFVATAISHWHAVGVDTVIYDIVKRNNGIKPNGLIFILEHEVSGFVIGEKDFVCEGFANVKFIFLSLHDRESGIYSKIGFLKILFKKINFKNNNKRIICLISPFSPSTDLIKMVFMKDLYTTYYIKLILIDEGFGTYVPQKLFEASLKRGSLNETVRKVQINRVVSIIIRRSFIKLIIRNMPLEKRFIFNQEKDYEINTELINSYKKIFEFRKKNFELTHKNSVVLLTGTFSEHFQMSIQNEIELMKSLIKILNQEGYYVLLKAHPRETIGKYDDVLKDYDVKQLDNDFPVEDLFINIDPVYVIGFISTALINAKLFYDMDVVSVADLSLEYSDSGILKSQMDEFKKVTSSFIKFTTNMGELKQILKGN
ncbi:MULTISPECIES: polysialyltransferase family glycosyltransferase [Methanobacterium]|uniref:Polysialyltransferase family glycosyltransferase n=1 Tax=Methanobacterium veterum TaxID=408577 RepID=A0A9E5DKM8_9EURY|nr:MULTISPECIES: polysialyltransferase family glycosyltransferase [Methanobacterium]MCZ3367497.1 polysialyltransferase family glycosyltransferase [Methanobacterium veterum]MCZ3373355.1 polysialyltransferase family glycosyltransferase [Methanobacterium veterum]